jgi:hypothetical protein
MKTIGIAILPLLCLSSVVANERMNTPDLSMVLLNYDKPFVSETLAERLATLVVAEKYPPDHFVVAARPQVSDLGELWSVTLINSIRRDDENSSLPTSNGILIAKQLTVTIRKYNAEIVSIK